MKRLLLAVALFTPLMPAAAQNTPAPGEGIVIGGTSSPPVSSESCVEVEIGGQSAFHCFNQKLKREVDKINPSINLPPIDAKSPDIRSGVISIPGVQQQYGQNFGRSVVPFRPPTPTYGAPTGPRR